VNKQELESKENEMNQNEETQIPEIIQKYEQEILSEWLDLQQKAVTRRNDLISGAELREQSRTYLAALRQAAQAGGVSSLDGQHWVTVKELLGSISASRAQQGFTPTETATFVFSLKQPLFDKLRREFAGDTEALGRETWAATEMLDKLGLQTTEVYQKTREEVIARQQQELMELSTPVVQLWDGILALPLIGTLDSERTQVVMENLLQSIVDTGSNIAIIDITGVPLVDTLVAQHLLKTVAAARLMGADCIISGIRPQIAQTIVHLGVDLGNVISKATLADAFAIALQRVNKKVVSSLPREEGR
jgi:rsbT co-antagonist protein RsbR